MKKFMILSAGLIMLTATADAQSKTTMKTRANNIASENVMSKPNQAQYFSLGPIAGFGHSWVNGMNNTRFKPAGYLGVELVFSKYEHWAWSTNLVASHEGYRTDYARNGRIYTSAVDPTYIRMTPKATYFFGRYGDNVRPKIFAGPSIAVKVAEDYYTDDNGMYYDGVRPVANANSDMFRTIDAGVEAGTGVNMKVARHIWFNVDASYYQGLVYATKNDNFNQNVKLNLGLMFGL